MPALLALLLVGLTGPPDNSNEPAVSIWAVRPDLQLERLIALFEGSRASDPAAALASWRRATNNSPALGKGAEAAIAALNPNMIPELKTLDDAGFLLDFAPTDDHAPLWAAVIPRDDGVFSAFATAMALTDGASMSPLDGGAVDRLGPPGAPLMARWEESVVIGGSRDGLSRGKRWLEYRRRVNAALAENRAPDANSRDSRLEFMLNPNPLSRSPSLPFRRLGETILGLDCASVFGYLALQDRGGSLEILTESQRPSAPQTADPRWTGDLPSSATAAFSIALDTRAASLDRFFATADRAEKADSARVKAAPIRVRMNLIARAAKLDPEADLWPGLVGVSGFLLGEANRPGGAALGLHMRDGEAARTLRTDFLPRLATALRLEPGAEGGARPDRTRLGILSGRALDLVTETTPENEATVWIAWGDEAFAAIQSVRRGSTPSWRVTERAIDNKRYARLGWIRVSGLGLAPQGSPLAEALRATPVLRWTGENLATGTADSLLWGDLRPAVRRFLDVIPQEAAPATRP